MKKLGYILCCLLTCLCFMPKPAVSAALLNTETGKAWAEQKGREIINILTSEDKTGKYILLDEIMLNDVDLNYAARFVVGKYWRQMTTEQKKEYWHLFKQYAGNLYKSYPLDIPKGSVEFSVDRALVDQKKINVYCTIKVKELEEKLDSASQGGFRVIFVLVENKGKIQVRDLKIEESSFLLAQRERFYKMIHQDCDDDIVWFLEDFANSVKAGAK